MPTENNIKCHFFRTACILDICTFWDIDYKFGDKEDMKMSYDECRPYCENIEEANVFIYIHDSYLYKYNIGKCFCKNIKYSYPASHETKLQGGALQCNGLYYKKKSEKYVSMLQ